MTFFLRILLLCLAVWLAPATVFAQVYQKPAAEEDYSIRVGKETNMNVRIRLQPRLDAGDLITSREDLAYKSESEMYFRRVRLEFKGNFLSSKLKFALVLDRDNLGRAGEDMLTNLNTAFLEYTFADEFSVRFGKSKLPFSRVYYTSSAEQLLIERPAFALDVPNDTRTFFHLYMTNNLLFSGMVDEGVLRYFLCVGDGWQPRELLYLEPAPVTVLKSDPLYVARLEFSPPGWTEKKRSDAHLGLGRHLTFGADYAAQHDIQYTESANGENRSLLGADLSLHDGGLTAQIEYNAWRIDSDLRGRVHPAGWYAQAGYYIPSLNLEPVVRYEIYEEDRNSRDTVWKVVTVGANWYVRGHNLKYSANWVHMKFDPNATGRLPDSDHRDLIQIQAQFYL